MEESIFILKNINILLTTIVFFVIANLKALLLLLSTEIADFKPISNSRFP